MKKNLGIILGILAIVLATTTANANARFEVRSGGEGLIDHAKGNGSECLIDMPSDLFPHCALRQGILYQCSGSDWLVVCLWIVDKAKSTDQIAYLNVETHEVRYAIGGGTNVGIPHAPTTGYVVESIKPLGGTRIQVFWKRSDGREERINPSLCDLPRTSLPIRHVLGGPLTTLQRTNQVNAAAYKELQQKLDSIGRVTQPAARAAHVRTLVLANACEEVKQAYISQFAVAPGFAIDHFHLVGNQVKATLKLVRNGKSVYPRSGAFYIQYSTKSHMFELATDSDLDYDGHHQHHHDFVGDR